MIERVVTIKPEIFRQLTTFQNTLNSSEVWLTRPKTSKFEDSSNSLNHVFQLRNKVTLDSLSDKTIE